MSKVPVNIKLELEFWQELELARGDVNRTRFMELLLDRGERGHLAAWAAFDKARGLELTHAAPPQGSVPPEPRAAATPPPDTSERPVKRAPKPRAKKQAVKRAPEPPDEHEPAVQSVPKRAPRMRPVLTGRLKN